MASSQEAVIKKLIALAQLDVDAVLAYEQALKNIDDGETAILEALESFKADHVRHIDDLSEVVRGLGETPPEFSRDLKGLVIEGMTALMSKVGTRSALLAMTQNEMLTNSSYKAALEMEMPRAAKLVIERNYADEQRHIAVIKQAYEDCKKQQAECLC